MSTLIVSTRNRHKLDELRSMLPSSVRVLGVDVLGNVPEIEEPSPTFEGNSKAKAYGLAHFITQKAPEAVDGLGGFPLWVLADDSGLAVDRLRGEPGVHSARFAYLGTSNASNRGNAPDAENNAKLLRLLAGVPREERQARFVCVLTLLEVRSSGEFGSCLIVQGQCRGVIREDSSGGHGFGYDPLFEPEGYTATFAQLGADVKNSISHRSRALEELLRSAPPAFLK